MEGKMINAILDIHAHKQEAGSECKSIINYWLSEGSSFQEGCYYSVGIHPWKLTVANFDQQLDFLIERLPDKRVVAIGYFDGASDTGVCNADTIVGNIRFAVDNPLCKSDGPTVGSEKTVSTQATLDMARFPRKA